ncbi:MAG: putative bifunctional diguanylate cyclase/phosphodiesterase [Solirubrobacteraceae bacterium]
MPERPKAESADQVPGASLEPQSFDYVGLLRGVPAILYTAEPGEFGRWLYVSPQIEAVLGFTATEWCRDPAPWESRLHPEDRDWVLSSEEAIVARGGITSGELVYRLRHRDGHYVWVRDDGLVAPGRDGRPCWQGVLSDVTAYKRAEAELTLRCAQQAAVASLGQRALDGASQGELMQEAVDDLVALLGMDIAAVAEHLPEQDVFVFRVTHGMPLLDPRERVPGGLSCQSGYVVHTGRPCIVADWEHETRFRRSRVLSDHEARCGLTVAIEGRHGPFGALGCHSRTLREIPQGDVDFAQALANVLGDLVERELTADEIRHQALHDPLTGLPNRILFLDRLSQATERLRRRPESLTAILALDLDRFKLVNDSLGHQAGDELLAAAAPRLKLAVRSTDTVARFGDDEFGILLEDIGDEQDAIDMAQRIAAVFTRPFVLTGNEHFITTSIGISLARGGEQADELLRDADAAMHRAKERGRARYELFDEGMRGRAMYRLRVENSLRRALERDELTLDYQPVVSLTDRSVVAVEALIRWEHPERGRIPPVEFIPVAEENGLIDAIGRWVLQRACRQTARWHRMWPDSRPLQMSVNLSAAQVRDPSLVGIVADALRSTGIDPLCLALELTESVLVDESVQLHATLDALKGLGVRLVLDDFGTGYSSLSYLSRLPFDALKIDRSFVDGLGTEPRDTAIAEAIVAMARALSLNVVGEGAETEGQVAELRRLGCDLIQGYHFSPPVAPVELERMLSEGPPWASPAPRRRPASRRRG